MFTYKFLPNTGGIENKNISRSDGACIPPDLDNSDYQEYLKFLAEGGQTLPADE